MMNKVPTFYIPHGGGPCFDISWPEPHQAGIDQLGVYLSQLASQLANKPRAIVMVTAHWVTDEFTVSANPKPSRLYDYSGFPAHTYQLKYDAPGSSEIAQEVTQCLELAGIPIKTDMSRGFDHGTFVPLRKVYPQADIPIIQFSIKHTMKPEEHLRVGKALAPLREKGILILGSGMSYHNFAGFMNAKGGQDSIEFDAWLTETIKANPQERNQRLTQWDSAPAGREAHPQEDHLIPLMVVAGAAGDDLGHCDFTGSVLGVTVSAYRFG
jgi:aromatic ring-opening dioxygenase catalytic subunit (LigB family)